MLILDWELPNTSGPEVVRWTRQELDASLPILIVTHSQRRADIVEGLHSGADDFMTKPVRVAELKARVRRCCAGRTPAAPKRCSNFGPYTLAPHYFER